MNASPPVAGRGVPSSLLLPLGLLGVLCLELWLRWPGLTEGGFASHDVAGILYSAMVLDGGGLPYVDTVELKAPGTFYLAWLLAGEGGRDISSFQLVANLWALLGTCVVYATAVTTGPRGPWRVASGIAVAALYGLQMPWLDSMDANYVTWANGFQVMAMAAGFRACAASTSSRSPVGGWLLAGVLAGLAGLCKRQAGFVVVPLLVLAWTVSDTDPRPEPRAARVRAMAWLAMGVLAPTLALGLHYGARGELGALVDGLLLNRWGWSYVTVEASGVAWWTEGLLATGHFLALPLGLLALGILRAGRGMWTPTTRVWVVWLVVMIGTAWIGGRFYKGYFVLALAPACALGVAGAHAVLVGDRSASQATPARGRRWAWRGVCAVATGLLLWHVIPRVAATRAQRGLAHDTGGRRIATYLQARTAASDTIWVWGWHLWDVYPLANRRSGSRIYKSLGVLTPPNDDTWRRRASPLRFEASERSAQLVRELRERRPRYIVLGSTVPRSDFSELQRLLRTDYVLDRGIRVGRVQMWRRRD